MIQNKRFQNNENLEVVTIIGENGPFYNLSNGANIKKDIFFQRYSELIPDASNFFSSQSASNLQSLAEQLRSVDSSRVPDGDSPAQVTYKQPSISEPVPVPPDYKGMLDKKRLWEEQHRDLSDYKVYDDDEEAAADFERRIQANQQPKKQNYPQQPQYQQEQEYQPVMEQNSMQSPSQAPAYVSAEEEAFRFFKSFKKVFPIVLTVDFEEKIAQPDFIKLMAVNYEGDIIKYYTKEFMNRIYNDPGFLENKVYEKLREIVFAEPEVKERKPRVTKAKPTPPPIVTESRKPKKEKKING